MKEEQPVSKSKSKKIKRSTIFVLSIILFVISAVLFGGYSVYFYNVSWTTRGQFGDMFGGVNALFSGLAFTGIIYTIILQRQDLKLQRKELKSTRKVFEAQRTLMELQQNSSIFFKMIENHINLIKSFSEKIGKNPTEGHELLNEKLKIIEFNLEKIRSITKTNKGDFKYFGHLHYKLLLLNEHKMLYTFTSIETIIRFVNVKLNNDKIFHETLFNALSKDEKFILALYIEYNYNESKKLSNESNFEYTKEYYHRGYSNPKTYNIPVVFFEQKEILFSSTSLLNTELLPKLIVKNVGGNKIEIIKAIITTDKKIENKFPFKAESKEYLINQTIGLGEDFEINLLPIIDLRYFTKAGGVAGFINARGDKDFISTDRDEIAVVIHFEGKEYSMEFNPTMLFDHEMNQLSVDLNIPKYTYIQH